MSADSPRRSSRGTAVPATVPPQVVSDRSILDSAIGFISDVTLANQPHGDPKDTITWASFETAADISDPRFGEDWELEGNVAPPLLLVLGYGLGVQVWAIPANGEAVEVLSWRHGVVTALRVLPTPSSPVTIEDNGRTDDLGDNYADKRPLIAVVDCSPQQSGQQQHCTVNFISLKTGTQVKNVKLKNPVHDVMANRCSIVITLTERILVLDARTLDDRLSISQCYPSPGINPNPVALGARWLAYADHKLIHSKRSGGGCDGEGVASYTATVLNAAKSLSKGLRGFGEQMAAGLTGSGASGSYSRNSSFDSGLSGEFKQPGVVTIMDIKHPINYSPTSGAPTSGGPGPVIAHFVAHSEAVVALEFDNSGMVLATADKRGHDFHIYRIQPHPTGSSMAAVHHLYVLHRGDTSAKVQNITFSLDTRWVAVSTLRGTTHVFPITPYGGPMGVRTHTSLHVVNKLSRFHRSAGLSAEGRSNSPITHSESTTFTQSLHPYHNPTLPPFPRPTIVQPLAQLRQSSALGSPPSSASVSGKSFIIGGSGGTQRQRLSSLSDDNGKPLSVCATFAKSRSWLLDPPNTTREAPHRIQRKAVDSLFVMAGHGALIQYDLDTKLAPHVAKEKICDDTPIELEVEAKAQWNLGRRKDGSHDIQPPLTSDNWLVKKRNSCMLTDSSRLIDDCDEHRDEESWLSQVEITTHAGPHRRLWMGPQFVFKNYNTPSGSNLNHVDVEAVEIGAATATGRLQERSSPLNMPLSAAGRAAAPVLIESGSYSSIEMSPKLMDRFRHDHLDSDFAVAQGDSRLKEDLADAMRESPSVSHAHKDTGRLSSDAASSSDPFYDAVTEHDDDDQSCDSHRSAISAAALASALPNICSYETSSSVESSDSQKKPQTLEKVVNPLGTVTTVTAGMSAASRPDLIDEVASQLAAEDCVIHENCDEALFRPVVTIFCNENMRQLNEEELRKNEEHSKPPKVVGNKLIVPVIAKEDDVELCKKEKQKNGAKAKQKQQLKEQERREREEERKFAELSSLNARIKASGKNAQIVVVLPKVENKMTAEATLKESLSLALAEESDEVPTKLDKVEEAASKTANKGAKVTKADVVKAVEPKQVEKTPAVKTIKATRDSEATHAILKKDVSITLAEEKEEIKKTQPPEEFKKAPAKVQAQVETVRDVAVKQTPKKPKQAEEPPIDDAKVSEFKRMKAIAPEKPAKQQTIPIEAVKKKENKSESAVPTSAASKAKQSELQAPEKHEVKEAAKEQSKVRETTPSADVLNVQDLADSMLDVEQSPKASIVKKAAKETKEKLLEPVEIFTAPPKPTKKSKQGKQNKSESNSEAEEKVALSVSGSKTTKSKSPKVVEIAQTSKNEEGVHSAPRKQSPSSDDSYSELGDSLLETRIKSQSSKTGKVEVKPTKEDVGQMKTTAEQEKSSKTLEHTEELKASEVVKQKISSYWSQLHKEPVALKKTTTEEKLESGEITETTMPEKSKESKGAVKKLIEASAEKSQTVELKQKLQSKEAATVKPEVVEEDTKKLQTVEALAAENVAKKVESKQSISPKNASKSRPRIIYRSDADIMPPPTTASSKPIAQPEPVKVITEQPMRTKKTTDESKSTVRNETNKGEKIAKPSFAHDAPDGLIEYKVRVTEGYVDTQLPAPVKSASHKQQTGKPKENEASPPPSVSAWKTMSGAAMINKNLESFSTTVSNYSSLEGNSSKKKLKKDADSKTAAEVPEKLLPDLPTPMKSSQDFGDSVAIISKASGKKQKKQIIANFEDFPLLIPMEDLPTLPPLEQLENVTPDSKSSKEHVSLINFESPLQESPAMERKNKLSPRDDANYVLTLCGGSLHYVNENTKPNGEKTRDAASSTLGEQSVADKSFIENDEQFMSFEQSSLDNTNTVNEMFSSPNSSSEEIIVFEEKKMSKKQRRKKQQQLELQQQKEQLAAGKHNAAKVDEEFLPLIRTPHTQKHHFTDRTPKRVQHFIALSPRLPEDVFSHKWPKTSLLANSATTDSEGPMLATTIEDNLFSLPSALATGTPNRSKHHIIDRTAKRVQHFTAPPLRLSEDLLSYKWPKTAPLANATTTTTDSEGPMPATTSEDNIFSLSSALTTGTPHKLKTKKLEHKINLLAAIEAATSSSTSSAEESDVEEERSSDMDAAVVTVTPDVAQDLPAGSNGSAAQQSAAKKKSKRRKR